MKKVFDSGTSGTHFLFDGSFYDQIDGITIRSPLGHNLFMGYYEANWLQVLKDCEIIVCLLYVDDIICLFNSQSDADEFYEFLNKQHPIIEITLEKQQNDQISILDILIIKNSENVSKTIFRKTAATALGLFTNYLRFTYYLTKLAFLKL